MNGLREPVGSEPGETYWRRRIVALTLVVLAIVVAYFLIVSPGGDEAKEDTKTPAVTADASVTPPAGVTDLSRACTAADVTLTATPNPFTFGSGALPVFDVAITHAGTSPCVLSTAGEASSLVVWSGGESNKDIYFSSAYCPADVTVTSKEYLLQGGVTEQFQVTWTRQRVGEGCASGATPGDGFYWAQVTLQGIVAEPTQFELGSA